MSEEMTPEVLAAIRARMTKAERVGAGGRATPAWVAANAVGVVFLLYNAEADRAALLSYVDKLTADLAHIDATLARRPALADGTRVEKIEKAINVAATADGLTREMTLLQAERDALASQLLDVAARPVQGPAHMDIPAIRDAMKWAQEQPNAAVQGPDMPPKAGTPFDMLAHLLRQREFSEKTFGPGARTAMVLDHIRKEIREIELSPGDLSEWIDIVILALDGAWRAGYSPDQIVGMLVGKQERNEKRKWPDWRTAPKDKAIEHDRTAAIEPAPYTPPRRGASHE